MAPLTKRLLAHAAIATFFLVISATVLGPLEASDLVTMVFVLGGVELGGWIGRRGAGEDRPQQRRPEKLL